MNINGSLNCVTISASLTIKLIPWNSVLVEKLTVSKLVKKLPSFYESRMFIIVFTTARHWSLRSARYINTLFPRHPL